MKLALRAVSSILFCLFAGGSADAAEILVTSDIALTTTWTANNTYNLQGQIYVLPGATLIIEPGTVIASSTGGGGSLAIARGAQIMACGTAKDPIIMTSKADVATWTLGDPTTGTWRKAASEWGNLTLMGEAFISSNSMAGNMPSCDPGNVATMEGLIATFPGDTRVLYGGGNDDSDSGKIEYLSLRYGGRVIALTNELNGLSLGGVGRCTDIHHVEIMNNVDDGIEIWGGTVNLKYFSIWNVGDDSFDIDQGWRGKGQFGLIVQGASLNAAQESGVGDNCFELDGAEDSDWQPVSTASFWNVTVIGQPVSGDGGTAWRDNARVQFHSCIFMDVGERLVRFDNLGGGNGYGFGGTLSWVDTWTTPYNAVPPHPNDCPPGTYLAQVSGHLIEFTDCVFFRNLSPAAYTEATARGVFDPANNNVLTPGFLPADAPIRKLVRGPALLRSGNVILPVIELDPRAKNAAVSSVTSAPSDGFFTPVNYRGAFHPNATPWICGWTAADAFGFLRGCKEDCFPGPLGSGSVSGL